jgi:TonB family protein
MDTTQVWTNIVAYVLQIGLLVGIGAALPALLRLGGGGRAPAARLLYWQVLLIACLALPWLRPWHSEVIAVASAPVAALQIAAHIGMNTVVRAAFPPITSITLWLLAAGVAMRLVWLAIGLMKLAGYRRQGRAIPLPPEWRSSTRPARLLVSDQINGPVTFGFFQPVVLLPASFPSMPEAMRDAILFHELLHVERRDWLFTLGEELLRAVFWFHPAIWWVLGEIQLAREQTVDQAVIEMTQARDPYVDTLLTMAGIATELDLAPAPLFLRRRHLKQRVMGIVQEVGMSKTRLILAQVAALATMAVACWFITGAIPLHAQAQMVADGAGVTVNLNGSQLMHRSPVSYPAEALVKGVEGTVVVQVRLDANGEVIDDAVLSGPDELRKGVQQSVLSWHFDKTAGAATRVVNIDFVKPANADGATAAPIPTRVLMVNPTAAQGGRGGAINTVSPASSPQQQLLALTLALQDELTKAEQEQARNPGPAQAAAVMKMQTQLQLVEAHAQLLAYQNRQSKVDSIVVNGLSDSAREQLLAQLPIHAGDTYSPETLRQIVDAAHQFDQHLTVSSSSGSVAGMWTVRIDTPEAHGMVTNTVTRPVPAGAQRIGSNVMAANLISAERPVYPPLAKMARQQGTVKFEATIGKDGKMENLSVVSGPPLLIPAALDAVKQWVYKPTLLNGAPVEVVTTIDVNFSLAGEPAPPAQ